MTDLCNYIRLECDEHMTVLCTVPYTCNNQLCSPGLIPPGLWHGVTSDV